MPSYKRGNWIESINALKALDMSSSEDGVWLRTPMDDNNFSANGFSWLDIGTSISWLDIGTSINWLDIGKEGTASTQTATNKASSENWIGWTYRKDAKTGGIPATGGGKWIPANNGTIELKTDNANNSLITEEQILAIVEEAIASLSIDWTSQVNGKPARYAPTAHSHLLGDVSGAASALHQHTVADISGLSAWLGGQNIKADKIVGLAFPDSDVTSVNGAIGDVNLTAADVEAAPSNHNHSASDLFDFSSAVSDLFQDLFTSSINGVNVSYDNITDVPNVLNDFINNLSLPGSGFLFKNGVNSLEVLANSDRLVKIAGFGSISSESGYLFFDGDTIILQSSQDDDLKTQIAAMVAMAWEQIRESVTWGKIPPPGFIHLR